MYEFFESQLAGVIVGGVIGIVGGFGLYYYQRRESQKDISRIVAADISFRKKNI